MSYLAPDAFLQVGLAITDIVPSTTATETLGYSATGLPPGLSIDRSTGVISGVPNTAYASTRQATVRVFDTAGNTAEVPITFPAVAPGLSLRVGTIAGDDTVNIAEKAAGFSIWGLVSGSGADVIVTVEVGGLRLTAISDARHEWSVNVPASAYFPEPSVTVVISASKAGFTSPTAVTRMLAVDLTPPSVSYTVPALELVGDRVLLIPRITPDRGVLTWSATGLPSWLNIDSYSGTISGRPETVDGSAANVTVTVTDQAGNSFDVSFVLPTLTKRVQRLVGFSYSPPTVNIRDVAPTVTPPTGAGSTLSYSATPSDVCVVDAVSGELALEGVGECLVTATAEGNARYREATATFSITVLEAGALALTANDIAGDDTVNIAEKAEGFSISGDTGSESGVTVTVTVGSGELTATSDANGAWSVNVPADANYIAEPSVPVTVSASKTGVASATVVTRTLAVDLTPPFVSYAAVPDTLKFWVRVDIVPFPRAADITSAHATGLPLGLRINSLGTINGRPTAADVNIARATVTVTDRAGNSADVSITFPAVAKADQTLTGFAYNASSVALGSAPPTVTAPNGVRTSLRYSATPSGVCTVDASTGALTLLAVGRCEVTATAAGTPDYNSATATFTVTVQAAGTLGLDLDAIADDNTVSIREKAAGFTISGNTGTVPDVPVTVTVGTAGLTATSGADGAWWVNVPANATYITESSVTVMVSASKPGLTPPSDVMRTLPVDLTLPSVSYPEPDVIQEAGVFVEITPSTSATDIAEYRWSNSVNTGTLGAPLSDTSSLHLDTTTGVISGVLERPFICSFLSTCIKVQSILVIDRAGNSRRVRASLTTANPRSGVTLHVDVIAEDNTVNIAEKAAGFTISGNTGTVPDVPVTVTVTVDTTELTATLAADGAWSVNVPADVAYITEPSVIVTVTVSAATTGFPFLIDVDRTLTVDLMGPTAPTYAAPDTLLGGVAIAAMNPSGGSDIAMYSATGLPPGLSIDAGTGVITGTPDTLNASAAAATVTVTDSAGNPAAAVSIAFPAVTELVTVSVAPASATEGEPVEFTVTLSGVVGWDVFLGWRAADGTATLGVDFDAAVDDFFGAAGYLTVNAGTTSATFTVATLEDILAESDETFTVTLVDVLGFREGVSLSPGMASATGTITDDDPLVAGVSVAETVVEGDTVEFSVSTRRIASFRAISTAPVVFTYTLGGTATAGDDYTAPDPPATLTVAAGDRFGRISIPTVGDSVLDPGETLTVTLSSATTTAGTVSVYPTSVTATTTIMDPGTETVSVAAAAPPVPEGEAAEFTVTLSGAVGTDVALDWSTAGDTATEGADYTAVSGGTVTFVPGGSLTQTISVTTLQDTLAESDETFTVTLAAPGTGLPTGVSLSTATATGTIEDDDPIVASVAADAGSVTEGGPAEFTVTLTTSSSRWSCRWRRGSTRCWAGRRLPSPRPPGTTTPR